MTLYDLERRNSLYFAFFAEFDCLVYQLRHVVEDTYCARKHCLPVPVFHFWP